MTEVRDIEQIEDQARDAEQLERCWRKFRRSRGTGRRGIQVGRHRRRQEDAVGRLRHLATLR